MSCSQGQTPRCGASLARLTVLHDDSMREVLLGRAESLDTRLTETELEVMSLFIGGWSTELIAEDRGLSERTISNQLRSGCHNLGLGDRRELKGWGVNVSGFILTQPPGGPFKHH